MHVLLMRAIKKEELYESKEMKLYGANPDLI